MGFSFRKRKGPLNISYSPRNGFGWSVSTKIAKNVTLNFKPGRKMRTTVNFGNGVRWTSSTAKTTEEKAAAKPWKAPRITKAEERRNDAYHDMKNEEFVHAYFDALFDIRSCDAKLLDHAALVRKYNTDIKNMGYFKTIENAVESNLAQANIFEYVAEVDEDMISVVAEREDRLEIFFEICESNSYLSKMMSEGYEKNDLKVAKNKFVELRSNIIAADNDIDYRRKIGWPEEYLMYAKVRRNNYVNAMKNLVEDNASPGKVWTPNSFLYIFKPRSIQEMFVLSGFIGFGYIFADNILKHFS